ncbi:sensor histidine kinase [Streptomyces sp. MI02-7b]|uniref:sensor histidine kinase n=1 Tax=Streptomyces sp. MI02-7b TaxID=462941 RepID=UPI0029A9824F|nr:histidine kinase [Streptomyces sp. MI02-7b]MDX3075980.1 histidine kinase [Streptomyces sp. MI02-7b]
MRRIPKGIGADIAVFLGAAAFSVLSAGGTGAGTGVVEQAVSAVACAALFLRRRWPVHLAVALLVTGWLAHLVGGPTAVAVFTVAAHRPLRTTAWIAALAFAPLPLFLAHGPDPDLPETGSALTFFAIMAGAIGWGLYVRSRRQLLASHAERGRRQAREEIAREMHDVLAHRLTLLSVHAGALEFHPGAPPAEIERAAGVIRDAAHQALEDLRGIIGVLREPGGPGAPGAGARPQPTLTDVPRLVAEAREAGMRVVLQTDRAAEEGGAATGRTVYRIVQEGLTNARKHAPGAEVTVRVTGGPAHGLTVEISNPAPDAASPGAPRSPAIPGAGQGLVGLTERAALAGGRLEHGPDGGGFRVRAWLPWAG